ncbi:unnamed protein product [Spirodela intermedia]|uniref:Leucine-rich repeat-containing N-terminal plant-type domain-containing protein n=1 Tax=Spirodela intermedia TaxID=51605 RepID=A0A7I8LGX3_SPIIN|nr:unnamed protein product [Spirodela intermedia]
MTSFPSAAPTIAFWGAVPRRLILTLIIIASSSMGCEGRGCHDNELRALLEIRKAFNFPNVSALPDWGHSTTNGGTDCCGWPGITCDSNTDRIVEMVLFAKRLSAAEETWHPDLTMLAEFGKLERLNLGFNHMGGVIQEVLNLSNNHIQDSLPTAIASMDTMESLDLSHNDLSGSIPLERVQLSSLSIFSVAFNNLHGPIPSVICNLKNLKLLDLSLNILNGPIPSCLCSLRSLTELDLSYNELQGDIPSCFGSFQSLAILNLFSNQFEGNYSSSMCSIESLTELHLSYDACPGNIPACLGNLQKLKYLQLGNRLNGSIPSSMFHNLTELTTLQINSDQLEGTLKFSVFANLSKLKEVDISSGRGLEIDTEAPISWHPSFQLSDLSIRDCVVNKRSNKRLPTFLWTQKTLETLILMGTSITDTLPIGLFCNSSLSSLDLRSNNISGLFVLPCHNASKNAFEINLSDNHLYGPLPKSIGLFFPKLNIFRIARNELEGPIPSSLTDRELNLLDLSDNHFSGKLPLGFTRNQTILSYVNVSYNQLQGELLPADAYMPLLQVLIIKNNKFTGSLLPKLANSSLLFIIDAGYNHFIENFSQALPLLPYMIVLSLPENRVQGYIPRTLCQMRYLRSLDLSGNNLSGVIPPCLHNISSWTSNIPRDSPIWIDSGPADPTVLLTSKNLARPFKADILYRMTLLDISLNKIHGVIPGEIGKLKGLRSLNLSNNQIQGFIPVSIADMNILESLDLSRNRLSGIIPEGMVHLNSLATLSLAFNNLSGIIPNRGQFPTFSKSSFEGNPGLCGIPVEKSCSSNNDGSNVTTDIGKNEENSKSLEDILFYSFCIVTFNLGFWGFLAGIFFNFVWRMMYFKIIDEL